MPNLFQNKYRIPSNRLPGYDYGADGWYFVTICTKNRVHYFGDIVRTHHRECDIVDAQLRVSTIHRNGHGGTRFLVANTPTLSVCAIGYVCHHARSHPRYFVF